MNTKKFIEEINRVFQIAYIQKLFQLILRSAWLGGAVYLLFRGVHQIFGVFPNSAVWVICAILIAVLNLVPLIIRRSPDIEFVWRLDRRFSLKEQAVTAYELSSEPDVEAEQGDDESMTDMLAKDAAAPLPDIRRRLVEKGWNLRPEIESTLVVLILLVIVYLNGVSIITQVPPGGMVGILPGLGSDPNAGDVFAEGNAGNGSAPMGQGDFSPIDSGEEINGSPLDLTVQDYEVISRILEQLGRDIEDDSITNQLGEALQEENYDAAAEEFGGLAENVSRISNETRQQLASEFLETAVELQDAGQNDVSQYFQDGASSLYGDSFPAMSESLDDLAQVMQYLSQFQRRQFLVSVDSDQSLQLDMVDELDAPVQMPGETSLPVSVGEPQEGEDFSRPNPGSVDEGLWQSYDLLLEDVDVVSTYFSTR